MDNMMNMISKVVADAFVAAGYDAKYGKVNVSNRPDLCEYQCNGALAAAKQYHKAPIMIANSVAEKLTESAEGSATFEKIEGVAPGFLNLNVAGTFLSKYVADMCAAGKEGRYGLEAGAPKRIVIDYGGANVAKPLHVGHLRSAIIGESLKRINRYMGNTVWGDVHLGDWGLQMGLIIEELRNRKPDLPYFDLDFTGEYPTEAPFTISELEEIYPAASGRAKEDEAFAARAHEATLKLQSGDPACTAIWKHIMAVSKADLKKNYDNLNVTFDLWKGESDAQPYIPDMIADFEARNIAHESQGALVVDVTEDSDSKEIPPCIVRKSDGAALYATSDLATLIEREKLYQPDGYIYVTDKRQEMHFTQVFRTARKAGIVGEDTSLKWIGFGTMNGSDGKPFKTRQGGVMRLEYLIAQIRDAVLDKTKENTTLSEEEIQNNATIIGLAALKYGDLSNQAAKDYVFDIDRFASFEGNTGPYILYTIVRIKSILKKYEGGPVTAADLTAPETESAKGLMKEVSKWNEVMSAVYEELAPHKICAYAYSLSDAFNHFYHETKILGEENEALKKSYIELITLVKEVLEASIDLLGFEAPERM